MPGAGTETLSALLGLGDTTQWVPLLPPEPLVLYTSCSLSFRAPASPHSQSKCDLSLAQGSGGTSCSHPSMLQSLGPWWQHLQQSGNIYSWPIYSNQTEINVRVQPSGNSCVCFRNTQELSVNQQFVQVTDVKCTRALQECQHTHQSTASLLSAAVASGAK